VSFVSFSCLKLQGRKILGGVLDAVYSELIYSWRTLDLLSHYVWGEFTQYVSFLKWKVGIEYQGMYAVSIRFASAKLYILHLFINKNMKSHCFYHRVHTEWQLPLSGVHFILMEKSAQPGKVRAGYKRPPYFTISIPSRIQSCSVRSSWEGRYSTPNSTLPLHELCGFTSQFEFKQYLFPPQNPGENFLCFR